MLSVKTLLPILGLVACGGGAAKPASVPSESEPALSEKARAFGAMCDRYYARERVCVNEYLSALLAVRVELDMPPGIAAEFQAEGRDAVLAKMRPEWERDTTLENTNRMCRDAERKTPAERLDGLMADGDRCYAMADCAGFTACTVETQRDWIKSGAPMH